MKKRITSMFLVLLMVLSLMPATVQASPASGGSGTKADPYLIATAQDLVDFRDEVNASTNKSTSTLCAKLTKDIDLSNLEGDWEPIGKATNTYKDYVAYDYDVNGTGTVGINDVQLIYNMYNAMYENFDMATMEKFLNADVNNDRKVNVLDANQAVQEMLKRNK